MNMTLPDKITKFLVLIGTLLISYTYISIISNQEKYFEKVKIGYDLNDSIQIEEFRIKFIDGGKNYESQTISKKVKDSLFLKKKIRIAELEKKKSLYNIRLEESLAIKKHFDEIHNLFLAIGLVCFFVGLFSWILDEPATKSQKNIINLEDKKYECCQSCSLKFNSLRRYGKFKDGTYNRAFCYECFDFGGFLEPELKKNKMIQKLIQNSKTKPLSKLIYFLRLNHLDRWS